MSTLVGALLLILLGLLGARFSFSASPAQLGPRLLFATGTHFLLLGLLLGGYGLDLLTRGVMAQLNPFLALGLGWIGLLFGLQLDRRQIARFSPRFLAVALLQALLAFGLFAALAALLLRGGGPLDEELRFAILAAAATAAISTPAGVAVLSQAFRVRGPLTQLLFFVASLDALVGLFALQLTFSVYHPLRANIGTALSAIEWIAVAVALGLVFGIFLLWVTRPKPTPEELVLFLLGIAMLSSGAALYVGLSPLLVSALAGAVVANISPLRRRIYARLQAWEKPLYVILLVLAGALLRFPSWLVLPLALGYVALRAVAKLAGAYLAVRIVRPAAPRPADVGVGLLPQGGLSIAMAINVTLTYGALGPAPSRTVEILFSTVLLGVAASQLIGPLLARDVLRRAGELTSAAAPAGA